MNLDFTNPDRRMHRIVSSMTRSMSVACVFASALVLAPCLNAQEKAPNDAPPPVNQFGIVPSTEAQPEPDLYTLKFDGRDVDSLQQQLKADFPNDNVVIAPSAKYVRLEAFEVRNVRLQELGKTIEFLSEGRLTVEVVPREKGTIGNIWRIASRNAAGPVANLKMRSVAAPNLFQHDELVQRIITEANELEDFRRRSIVESAAVRGGNFSSVAKTEIKALSTQRVFVLVGNEDGISGVESFIKAAEQRTVELAAEKRAQAASLAPKMRAVLAPHLFANEDRLNKITEEFENVQGLWNESHDQLMKMAGNDDRRGGVCVQQRPEQKVFVLIGSEEDIAGMESLIQAAEKSAADEDAKKDEAQAEIDELVQHLEVTNLKLDLEEKVILERKESLIAAVEERNKLLEIQKQDPTAHSPEEWLKLVSKADAQIKNLENAQAEGDAKSRDQIVKLRSTIFEIHARLEASRSKASPKE